MPDLDLAKMPGAYQISERRAGKRGACDEASIVGEIARRRISSVSTTFVPEMKAAADIEHLARCEG